MVVDFNDIVANPGLFAGLEVGLEVEVNAVEQIAVHELAVERLCHCRVLLVFVKRLVARLLDDVPLLINQILLNRLDHLVWRDTHRKKNLNDLFAALVDWHPDFFPKLRARSPYFKESVNDLVSVLRPLCNRLE